MNRFFSFFITFFFFVAQTAIAQEASPSPSPEATPIVEKQEVSIELALLVDVSGSISSSEFETQKQGYAGAFRSTKVQESVRQAGKIAVSLIYWSSSSRQEVAIPFTLVTLENVEAFADMIEATERPFGGGTSIGPAIDFSVPLFGQAFTSLKQVIDVSGDGASSQQDVELARDNALAAGIDAINGLPITQADSSLYQFYVNSVIGGEDPFAVASPTFEDFLEAATEKIARELQIIEQCPEDPLKLLPGECGCGVPDVDFDDSGVADCLECVEETSFDTRDGAVLSTEDLAKVGISSARQLRKLVKPIAKNTGLGINEPLVRFAGSSIKNIKKTEKAIKEYIEQLPDIFKPCPGPRQCISVDNVEDKERLRASVKRLNRLTRRITTRLFFYKLVENPVGALGNRPPEKLQKIARRKVVKRRKIIQGLVDALNARVDEIPDVLEFCE